MHIFNLATIVVPLVLATTTAAAAAAGKKTNPARVPPKAVLLSNVASLTLRADKRTTARRVSSVPQLECVGPKDVCHLYKVDVMRCMNEGADYNADDIQWACKASLPVEFKLGGTEVVCEGYESSDDPYVLKGSCGVEYRLLLTEKGEAKYRSKSYRKDYTKHEKKSTEDGKWTSMVFLAIFLLVLYIILKNLFSAARQNPPRLGGGRPYGNGGGDDPPPPYDGPPRYTQRPSKPSTSSSSWASSSSRTSPRAGTQQQGNQWRPGFWTGAATGAATAGAAGYAAGLMQNRAQNRAQTRPQVQDSQPTGYRSDGPSSSYSSSSSSERHESTGFGGTRRR